mmetsp:Transcript_7488/g.11406  ORF Transcript_7488/g.11406 Transcript_7488/m.11406 type:complete len:287 (-) Transcript_7488:53-913(-)|eukprot:CAMPEP_0178930108 /NCGR_PEP_ID=MMETSP0786-20121207/21029_1 /TAXON_ID=186022 /ORGANISM="Thalassionema frauenfeldii, Strain CCMP 1798" /LENGTH=286 /DNA_ID=CAMNT_0020606553 /DNA_START=571 /DNA_END=1431 /DNA_ORIENTATION=-
MSSSIEGAAVDISSPKYTYRYYYDSSILTGNKRASWLIFLVVGTNMSVNDYSDIATHCVTGQPTVVVMVDNNPGNVVKLNGEHTVAAFNDIMEHLDERIQDITFEKGKKILVGGHSAGGSSVIDAMNSGNFTFQTNGYIGLDPMAKGTSIAEKSIAVPTLAIGFTEETCKVPVADTGLAAYQVSPPNHRILLQVINPKPPGLFQGGQITHCVFTDGGCGRSGAWVRQAVGGVTTVFCKSLKGSWTSLNPVKADYVKAIDSDHQEEVNVFMNKEGGVLINQEEATSS